jgi:hypothetical protein
MIPTSLKYFDPALLKPSPPQLTATTISHFVPSRVLHINTAPHHISHCEHSSKRLKAANDLMVLTSSPTFPAWPFVVTACPARINLVIARLEDSTASNVDRVVGT